MSVYQSFKNLTGSELEQEEFRFNAKISNAELADEAWGELGTLFDQNPNLKNDYRLSYWRWFVILSWQKVYSVDPEIFLLIIKDQVPMAILAKIDVLDRILRYLAQNFYYREDLGSYFNKVRSEFFKSETVLGQWQGQDVRIKDAIAEFSALKKRNAGSMETAEFISKLGQAMFPKEVVEYAYVDLNLGVERFIELINFFQDIDNEKKILKVLDAFLVSTKSNSEEGARVSEEVVEKELRLNESVDKENLQPTVKMSDFNETVKILTPQQIKSQIESEFKKDTEGNFEDIDAVMRKLEEFTEMYNDPKIADLIYFDEEEGRFKWKI